jgi:hypothetical protein
MSQERARMGQDGRIVWPFSARIERSRAAFNQYCGASTAEQIGGGAIRQLQYDVYLEEIECDPAAERRDSQMSLTRLTGLLGTLATVVTTKRVPTEGQETTRTRAAVAVVSMIRSLLWFATVYRLDAETLLELETVSTERTPTE